MTHVTDIMADLDEQRKALGMSCRVLAARSGLSLRTVQRAFSNHTRGMHLRSLLAVANALGAAVELRKQSPDRLREQQARKKARHLAALAQGTAALEGLAVQKKALRGVERRIATELIVGPSIRLWS